MRNRFWLLFNALLALAAVNLLIACQPLKDTSSNTKSFGTSDSGGGTGVNNKVYESYIVDIQKHPAFLNRVLPLFKNLKRPSDEPATNLAGFITYKTWFIAPIDLEKIGKETLGVSHQKSDTQQIARQTKKEIWIDSRIFEKMSEKDQGDLILHEIVMSAYFIQFMSFRELCEGQILTMTEGGEGKKEPYSCDQIPTNFEALYKPQPWRSLTAQDNENIRYMTGWLLINAQAEISEAEFVKTMGYKGFDKRFFNTRSLHTNEDLSRKVKGRDLLDALKATQITGFMPNLCKDIGSEHQVSCRLEVTEGKFKIKDFEMPSIELKVFMDDRLVHHFQAPMADEMHVSGIRDEDGTISSNFSMTTQIGKIKIGDKVHYAFLNFRPGDAAGKTLRLDSVVIRPTVLVSFDKNRKEICEFRIPRKVKAYDHGMLIRREDTKMEIPEIAFQSIENLGYCSADTVD